MPSPPYKVGSTKTNSLETILPQVSIIIPTLNEASNVPELLLHLASIRTKSSVSSEIIIVDGGSADGTPKVLHPDDIVLVSQRGRAAQMNAGAKKARGELLIFLHADTRLPLEAASHWQRLLADSVPWAYYAVSIDHPGSAFRIIEWFMNTRSRLTSIATGDQVFCIRREFFEHCGGFSNIELMEDVDLSGRLKKRAKPLVFSEPVQCSARKWLKHGVVRTVIMMWTLRAAYFFGADPSKLRAIYYG
ncbi:MAG: TIGR04283 family arsenosugar biosynthesis glycosyltransferase [Pseudomonadales bacterium]